MTCFLPALGLALALAAPQGGLPQARSAVSKLHRKEALDHYRNGLDKMRDESWDEAEREFQMAVKLDPLFAMAYYGIGQARMATRRYPAAVEAFLACRKAHHELAALRATDRVLADQRRDEEIQELQDSLRVLRSGIVKATNTNAMILRIESRLQQLENERRRGATATVETPAEVSLALGSAYFRSGRLNEARQAYEDAVAVNPKMGEAHNNLAVLDMLGGRFAEARAEVKKAEKSGFQVNPHLKADIAAREKAAAKR